jgi:spore photoproduct lyase
MIDTIYLERDISSHPITKQILKRFKRADVIECQRYGEVFNRRAQNFRLQKRKPALILARKHAGHVLATPPGYGIGGRHNFYFSHLLNCVYDCRYCFLQGMYRSANYVLFVNYEDFKEDVLATINKTPGQDPIYFFSGYDCDSLALESVTGFISSFLDFFREQARAWVELRTKSVAIQELLQREAFERCVVAFSLTPPSVALQVEHGAPSIEKRLDAMQKLARNGWPLGLRFDPIVYHKDYRENYKALFEKIFKTLPAESIHSISLGPLRFPQKMYQRIHNLYPESKMLAGPLLKTHGTFSYPPQLEEEMNGYCQEILKGYLTDSIFFTCTAGEMQ